MDKFTVFAVFVISLLVLVLFGFIGGVTYDSLYVRPVASNKANDYCRSLGFDQYKTFSRVGIFSRNPVAIKCEYAERYTDLGVRTTQS